MTDLEITQTVQFDENGNPIVITQTPADMGDETKPVDPVLV